MENKPIASLSDLELATLLLLSINRVSQMNFQSQQLAGQIQVEVKNIDDLQAEIEKRQPKPEEKAKDKKK